VFKINKEDRFREVDKEELIGLGKEEL